MKKRQEFTEKHQKLVWGLAMLIFLGFCGWVSIYIGRPMLEFVSEPDRFRDWVEAHGIWGDIGFICMMTLQVLVALIPGEPLEIGAGYAFGVIRGTVLCMIGIAIGSAVIFWLVRRFGVKFVEVFFSQKEWKVVNLFEHSKHRDTLAFLLFLLPGTPKDLLSYIMGLTKIRFGTFMQLAIVARIPSIVTSTISGNALGEENYIMAAVAFVVTGALSVGGMMIYKKFQMKREKQTKEE